MPARPTARVALLLALCACDGQRNAGPLPPVIVVSGGTVYRRDAGRDVPLLTLEPQVRAPRPPTSWEPAPGSRFGVAASAFRQVRISPDGRWLAWETAGVHDLLGIVATTGAPDTVVVLDFFFGSSARRLEWAPAGRYLAALYAAPSGLDELRLYDVARAARLVGPWTAECEPDTRCEVSEFRWRGQTRLRVRTAAPGGPERTYRVDVREIDGSGARGQGSAVYRPGTWVTLRTGYMGDNRESDSVADPWPLIPDS